MPTLAGLVWLVSAYLGDNDSGFAISYFLANLMNTQPFIIYLVTFFIPFLIFTLGHLGLYLIYSSIYQEN